MGIYNNNEVSKINVIWLDQNVNNNENKIYQNAFREMYNFKLFVYTKVKDCLSKLEEIKFTKTYIIISGSISQKYFMEFEKIINNIQVCPEIMLFTSKQKFDQIKKNIINLDNFSLFDMI